MQELVLSNGARVRARPVPPHVTIQFNRAVSQRLPPEPQLPTKRVKMADGHIEDDVVTDGPEWDAYQAEHKAWEDECNAILASANDEYNDLQRDYAIIEWTWDGEHWRRDVPPDWERPQALDRAGLTASANKRVEYIGVELLTTPEDWAAVRAVAEGQADVTNEELARVRAGFRPGVGRKGNAPTARGGWLRRLALKISRRGSGGKSVGADA